MNSFLCTRRRMLTLVGGAVSVLAAFPAVARDEPELSPEDRAEVERVEAYLNGVKTIRARFVQVADTGEAAAGTFYLDRPGRLRVQYDPPNPNLLVANGYNLIHYDSSLETVAYLPLDSGPAGVLVREKIALAGDLRVNRVERRAGTLRVSIVQRDDPRAGEITLVFRDQPLALNQWRVSDAQGRVTQVTLQSPEVGVKLDPSLFKFEDPTFPGRRSR